MDGQPEATAFCTSACRCGTKMFNGARSPALTIEINTMRPMANLRIIASMAARLLVPGQQTTKIIEPVASRPPGGVCSAKRRKEAQIGETS
jgi:hypothetical protein